MNIEKLIQDYDQKHAGNITITAGDLQQIRDHAQAESMGDPDSVLFYAISAALKAGYAAGYKRTSRNQ